MHQPSAPDPNGYQIFQFRHSYLHTKLNACRLGALNSKRFAESRSFSFSPGDCRDLPSHATLGLAFPKADTLGSRPVAQA